MSSELIHTCGWQHNPEDKFCRGCGERIFKVSRDYVEISKEMENLRNAVSEKPNPAYAGIAMMMHNVLAWASGEAQTNPMDLLKQVEKMLEKYPEGFGFQPPPKND